MAARIDLGLTDRQFGALTPRLFYLLLDRHREDREHTSLMFGVVAATVANFSDRAPEKMLRPGDFFGIAEPKEDKPVRRLSKQAIADRLRGFLNRKMEQQKRSMR